MRAKARAHAWRSAQEGRACKHPRLHAACCTLAAPSGTAVKQCAVAVLACHQSFVLCCASTHEAAGRASRREEARRAAPLRCSRTAVLEGRQKLLQAHKLLTLAIPIPFGLSLHPRHHATSPAPPSGLVGQCRAQAHPAGPHHHPRAARPPRCTHSPHSPQAQHPAALPPAACCQWQANGGRTRGHSRARGLGHHGARCVAKRCGRARAHAHACAHARTHMHVCTHTYAHARAHPHPPLAPRHTANVVFQSWQPLEGTKAFGPTMVITGASQVRAAAQWRCSRDACVCACTGPQRCTHLPPAAHTAPRHSPRAPAPLLPTHTTAALRAPAGRGARAGAGRRGPGLQRHPGLTGPHRPGGHGR